MNKVLQKRKEITLKRRKRNKIWRSQMCFCKNKKFHGRINARYAGRDRVEEIFWRERQVPKANNWFHDKSDRWQKTVLRLFWHKSPDVQDLMFHASKAFSLVVFSSVFVLSLSISLSSVMLQHDRLEISAIFYRNASFWHSARLFWACSLLFPET